MHSEQTVSRRDFCRAVAALSAIGTVAAGNDQEKQDPGMRVAAFQCDVTPPLGHPIYPSFMPLAVVEQPLLAKGIVLGRQPAAVCPLSLDWCVLREFHPL